MSLTTNNTQDKGASPSTMSSSTLPANGSAILPPSPVNNTLSSQTIQPRRSRPGNVQTNLPSNSQLVVIPASAISNSSIASSSHGSPVLSPDALGLITGSSFLPSPEPFRGRDVEQFPAPNFQLPEPVLSRKTSNNSLHQPLLNGQSAMGDALKQQKGLIRRLSNRASQAIIKRRTSSAHPNSRDTSIGPAILRRRSDSTNTAPGATDLAEGGPAVETDSDVDLADEKDDLVSLLTFDGVNPEFSPTSATASVAGSTGPTTAQAGPVIPLALLKGTWIYKVSKKNKGKRIPLVLEPDSAKITWDKSRPWKAIYIDDIKEIRTAEDIRQYRLDCGIAEAEEPRFFSIMYAVPDKTQNKVMHLIAEDDETFQNWTMTLDAIYKHRQDLMVSLMAFNDRAVRAYWGREMNKQCLDKLSAIDDGEVDLAGVERICRNLHIHIPQEVLAKNFNAADTTHTHRLNFAEFQEFVKLMKRRVDIQEIYQAIASDSKNGITRDEFFRFLSDTQGENIDEDLAAWEVIFTRFARRWKSKDGGAVENGDDSPRMSEAALASLLTSTYNLPIIQEPKEYTLDRPMNEYFISSSHNTYLLGRQVMGISSVEGYISALIRGCRCVEIDCWDGADGQPIVVHGLTWTTRISFREVVNTINKYAFVKSPFPLWISLEVHCNADQQRIMAKIMREVFGSKLVTEPLPECADRLPTPSELAGRILVKTKKPQRVDDAAVAELAPGRRRGNSLTSPYANPIVLDNSAIPAQSLPQSSPLLSPNPSLRKASTKSRVDTITEGAVHEAPSSSTSDCDSGSDKLPTKKKQSKIVSELGQLAVYCVGLKFQGFDDPDCKLYNHILSFVENTFDRNSKSRDSKRALYRHNMRHLMRVYPNQTRFASTNFNPLPYWRKGVQMAALNWQTYDLGMQLNQAMFDGGTDQSGYVLKPKEFREIQVMPNLPGAWEGKRERKNVSFSIDVISAQQLMRPFNFSEKRTLDPFVEIEVFVPDEKKYEEANGSSLNQGSQTASIKVATNIVHQNGFNPNFDQRFNFKFTTKFPDLVFVKWTVKLADNGRHSNASTMASFTAKLSNLKQGYRTIKLLDNNADQYLFSTLFCLIRKDPITSVLVDYEDEGPENVNKIKSIKRSVFNRSSNQSPKSSVDGGPS